MDEFDYIEKYFRPLTQGNQAALGLRDDAAVVALQSDGVAILSKDILVAGTHFFDTDPLDLVAQKALRVNLSDCIAKGAVPTGYLLGCVWKKDTVESDIALFADGLARDAGFFTQGLLGGDTTRTSQFSGHGIAMVSVTILGATDRMVQRTGARSGDVIFITGTIGNSWLGLQGLLGNNLILEQHIIDQVTGHYHVPEIAFGSIGPVNKFAQASLDISDGLLADAGHMAMASDVGIELHADHIPFSEAAQKWCVAQEDDTKAVLQLVTGGDDYQVFCAVSPENATAFQQEVEQAGVRVTQIGQCTSGNAEVTLLDKKGAEIAFATTGFQHF